SLHPSPQPRTCSASPPVLTPATYMFSFSTGADTSSLHPSPQPRTCSASPPVLTPATYMFSFSTGADTSSLHPSPQPRTCSASPPVLTPALYTLPHSHVFTPFPTATYMFSFSTGADTRSLHPSPQPRTCSASPPVLTPGLYTLPHSHVFTPFPTATYMFSFSTGADTRFWSGPSFLNSSLSPLVGPSHPHLLTRLGLMPAAATYMSSFSTGADTSSLHPSPQPRTCSASPPVLTPGLYTLPPSHVHVQLLHRFWSGPSFLNSSLSPLVGPSHPHLLTRLGLMPAAATYMSIFSTGADTSSLHPSPQPRTCSASPPVLTPGLYTLPPSHVHVQLLHRFWSGPSFLNSSLSPLVGPSHPHLLTRLGLMPAAATYMSSFSTGADTSSLHPSPQPRTCSASPPVLTPGLYTLPPSHVHVQLLHRFWSGPSFLNSSLSPLVGPSHPHLLTRLGLMPAAATYMSSFSTGADTSSLHPSPQPRTCSASPPVLTPGLYTLPPSHVHVQLLHRFWSGPSFLNSSLSPLVGPSHPHLLTRLGLMPAAATYMSSFSTGADTSSLHPSPQPRTCSASPPVLTPGLYTLPPSHVHVQLLHRFWSGPSFLNSSLSPLVGPSHPHLLTRLGLMPAAATYMSSFSTGADTSSLHPSPQPRTCSASPPVLTPGLYTLPPSHVHVQLLHRFWSGPSFLNSSLSPLVGPSHPHLLTRLGLMPAAATYMSSFSTGADTSSLHPSPQPRTCSASPPVLTPGLYTLPPSHVHVQLLHRFWSGPSFLNSSLSPLVGPSHPHLLTRLGLMPAAATYMSSFSTGADTSSLHPSPQPRTCSASPLVLTPGLYTLPPSHVHVQLLHRFWSGPSFLNSSLSPLVGPSHPHLLTRLGLMPAAATYMSSFSTGADTSSLHPSPQPRTCSASPPVLTPGLYTLPPSHVHVQLLHRFWSGPSFLNSSLSPLVGPSHPHLLTRLGLMPAAATYMSSFSTGADTSSLHPSPQPRTCSASPPVLTPGLYTLPPSHVHVQLLHRFWSGPSFLNSSLSPLVGPSHPHLLTRLGLMPAAATYMSSFSTGADTRFWSGPSFLNSSLSPLVGPSHPHLLTRLGLMPAAATYMSSFSTGADTSSLHPSPQPRTCSASPPVLTPGLYTLPPSHVHVQLLHRFWSGPSFLNSSLSPLVGPSHPHLLTRLGLMPAAATYMSSFSTGADTSSLHPSPQPRTCSASPPVLTPGLYTLPPSHVHVQLLHRFWSGPSFLNSSLSPLVGPSHPHLLTRLGLMPAAATYMSSFSTGADTSSLHPSPQPRTCSASPQVLEWSLFPQFVPLSSGRSLSPSFTHPVFTPFPPATYMFSFSTGSGVVPLSSIRPSLLWSVPLTLIYSPGWGLYTLPPSHVHVQLLHRFWSGPSFLNSSLSPLVGPSHPHLLTRLGLMPAAATYMSSFSTGADTSSLHPSPQPRTCSASPPVLTPGLYTLPPSHVHVQLLHRFWSGPSFLNSSLSPLVGPSHPHLLTRLGLMPAAATYMSSFSTGADTSSLHPSPQPRTCSASPPVLTPGLYTLPPSHVHVQLLHRFWSGPSFLNSSLSPLVGPSHPHLLTRLGLMPAAATYMSSFSTGADTRFWSGPSFLNSSLSPLVGPSHPHLLTRLGLMPAAATYMSSFSTGADTSSLHPSPQPRTCSASPPVLTPGLYTLPPSHVHVQLLHRFWSGPSFLNSSLSPLVGPSHPHLLTRLGLMPAAATYMSSFSTGADTRFWSGPSFLNSSLSPLVGPSHPHLLTRLGLMPAAATYMSSFSTGADTRFWSGPSFLNSSLSPLVGPSHPHLLTRLGLMPAAATYMSSFSTGADTRFWSGPSFLNSSLSPLVGPSHPHLLTRLGLMPAAATYMSSFSTGADTSSLHPSPQPRTCSASPPVLTPGLYTLPPSHVHVQLLHRFWSGPSFLNSSLSPLVGPSHPHLLTRLGLMPAAATYMSSFSTGADTSSLHPSPQPRTCSASPPVLTPGLYTLPPSHVHVQLLHRFWSGPSFLNSSLSPLVGPSHPHLLTRLGLMPAAATYMSSFSTGADTSSLHPSPQPRTCSASPPVLTPGLYTLPPSHVHVQLLHRFWSGPSFLNSSLSPLVGPSHPHLLTRLGLMPAAATYMSSFSTGADTSSLHPSPQPRTCSASPPVLTPGLYTLPPSHVHVQLLHRFWSGPSFLNSSLSPLVGPSHPHLLTRLGLMPAAATYMSSFSTGADTRFWSGPSFLNSSLSPLVGPSHPHLLTRLGLMPAAATYMSSFSTGADTRFWSGPSFLNSSLSPLVGPSHPHLLTRLGLMPAAATYMSSFSTGADTSSLHPSPQPRTCSASPPVLTPGLYTLPPSHVHVQLLHRFWSGPSFLNSSLSPLVGPSHPHLLTRLGLMPAAATYMSSFSTGADTSSLHPSPQPRTCSASPPVLTPGLYTLPPSHVHVQLLHRFWSGPSFLNSSLSPLVGPSHPHLLTRLGLMPAAATYMSSFSTGADTSSLHPSPQPRTCSASPPVLTPGLYTLPPSHVHVQLLHRFWSGPSFLNSSLSPLVGPSHPHLLTRLGLMPAAATYMSSFSTGADTSSLHPSPQPRTCSASPPVLTPGLYTLPPSHVHVQLLHRFWSGPSFLNSSLSPLVGPSHPHLLTRLGLMPAAATYMSSFSTGADTRFWSGPSFLNSSLSPLVGPSHPHLLTRLGLMPAAATYMSSFSTGADTRFWSGPSFLNSSLSPLVGPSHPHLLTRLGLMPAAATYMSSFSTGADTSSLHPSPQPRTCSASPPVLTPGLYTLPPSHVHVQLLHRFWSGPSFLNSSLSPLVGPSHPHLLTRLGLMPAAATYMSSFSTGADTSSLHPSPQPRTCSASPPVLTPGLYTLPPSHVHVQLLHRFWSGPSFLNSSLSPLVGPSHPHLLTRLGLMPAAATYMSSFSTGADTSSLHPSPQPRTCSASPPVLTPGLYTLPPSHVHVQLLHRFWSGPSFLNSSLSPLVGPSHPHLLTRLGLMPAAATYMSSFSTGADTSSLHPSPQPRTCSASPPVLTPGLYTLPPSHVHVQLLHRFWSGPSFLNSSLSPLVGPSHPHLLTRLGLMPAAATYMSSFSTGADTSSLHPSPQPRTCSASPPVLTPGLYTLPPSHVHVQLLHRFWSGPSFLNSSLSPLVGPSHPHLLTRLGLMPAAATYMSSFSTGADTSSLHPSPQPRTYSASPPVLTPGLYTLPPSHVHVQLLHRFWSGPSFLNSSLSPLVGPSHPHLLTRLGLMPAAATYMSSFSTGADTSSLHPSPQPRTCSASPPVLTPGLYTLPPSHVHVQLLHRFWSGPSFLNSSLSPLVGPSHPHLLTRLGLMPAAATYMSSFSTGADTSSLHPSPQPRTCSSSPPVLTPGLYTLPPSHVHVQLLHRFWSGPSFLNSSLSPLVGPSHPHLLTRLGLMPAAATYMSSFSTGADTSSLHPSPQPRTCSASPPVLTPGLYTLPPSHVHVQLLHRFWSGPSFLNSSLSPLVGPSHPHLLTRLGLMPAAATYMSSFSTGADTSSLHPSPQPRTCSASPPVLTPGLYTLPPSHVHVQLLHRFWSGPSFLNSSLSPLVGPSHPHLLTRLGLMPAAATYMSSFSTGADTSSLHPSPQPRTCSASPPVLTPGLYTLPPSHVHVQLLHRFWSGPSFLNSSLSPLVGPSHPHLLTRLGLMPAAATYMSSFSTGADTSSLHPSPQPRTCSASPPVLTPGLYTLPPSHVHVQLLHRFWSGPSFLNSSLSPLVGPSHPHLLTRLGLMPAAATYMSSFSTGADTSSLHPSPQPRTCSASPPVLTPGLYTLPPSHVHVQLLHRFWSGPSFLNSSLSPLVGPSHPHLLTRLGLMPAAATYMSSFSTGADTSSLHPSPQPRTCSASPPVLTPGLYTLPPSHVHVQLLHRFWSGPSFLNSSLSPLVGPSHPHLLTRLGLMPAAATYMSSFSTGADTSSLHPSPQPRTCSASPPVLTPGLYTLPPSHVHVQLLHRFWSGPSFLNSSLSPLVGPSHPHLLTRLGLMPAAATYMSSFSTGADTSSLHPSPQPRTCSASPQVLEWSLFPQFVPLSSGRSLSPSFTHPVGVDASSSHVHVQLLHRC
ncbi:unnamed protein product, partial [Closterium sp. Naga37s-1]